MAPGGNGIGQGLGFVEVKRIDWTDRADDWTLLRPLDRDEKKDEKGNVIVPALREIVPIRNRWIYVFETAYDDQGGLAILAREFHADENGALSMVDGKKRRFVEAAAAPKPVGVPDAALPVVRQDDRPHYVSIGVRGRLSAHAIRDLEAKLTGPPSKWLMASIYKPQDPAARESLTHTKDKQHYFLDVIDPLTLGEYLSGAYQRALTEFRNYWIPSANNPSEMPKAAARAAECQLAKLIEENLRLPDDPLEIEDFLRDVDPTQKSLGKVVSHVIAQGEIKTEELATEVRRRIKTLIRFLDSAIWAHARRWYLGMKKIDPTSTEATTIGHLCTDAEGCLQARMNETREGRTYLYKKAEDPEQPLSWLLAPEKEHEKADPVELYKKWLPVFRASITGSVLALAELAPALALYPKIRTLEQLKALNGRIAQTINLLLGVPVAKVVSVGPTGRISATLFHFEQMTYTTPKLRIDTKKAEAALGKWLEGGKPQWPDGTKLAKASDVGGHLGVLAEILNVHNEIREIVGVLAEHGSGEAKMLATMKVAAAAVDLAVASEAPIQRWARGLAGVEDGEEAGSVVARLTKPAAFKALGAAAAAIEAYVQYLEAREAGHRGQKDLRLGHNIAAFGSGGMAVGSALAAAGYTASEYSLSAVASALTAASSGLIVLGVAATLIGSAIVAWCDTTPWQEFARHCVFGTGRGEGETLWNGGNFSRWTEDAEGLALQSRVLTAMLCSFKMHGAGFGGVASEVQIAFGGIPPNAELQIQFDLTFADGRTANPGYAIDLQKHKPSRSWGGARYPGKFQYTAEEGTIRTLNIAPDPLGRSKIVSASCSALITYGRGAEPRGPDVAKGTIPIHGRFIYPLFHGTHTNTEELDSLEAK